MATPTRAQAAEFQARQATIAAAAGTAVARSVRQRLPWGDIATQISNYQAAATTAAVRTVAAWAGRGVRTDVTAFTGVSSSGFPVLEPLIATIDRVVPAPVEPLPDSWWEDAQAFIGDVEQLIASEIADAARSASQVELAEQGWTNYIRMLNPPSCDRCTILAGRIYRDLDSFARHPGCDCVMVPVDNIDAAKAEGLIADPIEAFDRGLVRGLSKADARAVADGADLAQVVNAKRAGLRAPTGITNAYVATTFGRQAKATLHGTTKRAKWRKDNPTRLVRLRPESIYQYAADREDALRLLKLYGYVR